MVKLRRSLAERLSAATPDSGFEADVILETVFGRDWRLKDLCGELKPSAEELKRVAQMLDRRLSGEPLQYIVGEWEFYGLTLRVGPGALIPRQDTETLVETALRLIERTERPRVLDLCAGTGCVAAAIKSRRTDAVVCALELSPAAFEILSENGAHYGVETVLADALDSKTAEKFSGLDLITANPPYLTAEDMSKLQPELRFEPNEALFGGSDGLDFYRALPKIWRESLKTGGLIAFEVGLGQHSAAAELLLKAGWRNTGFSDDLTGRTRVVYAEK